MTIGFLGNFYPWAKAFHVISLIAWMAATFYMPRLFVYHCDLRPGSAESERFKIMEYRLFKQIMNPAMIATWIFGIMLVLTPGVLDWSAGWWHVKLLCVVLMSGFTGQCLDGARTSWPTPTGVAKNFTASPTKSQRC